MSKGEGPPAGALQSKLRLGQLHVGNSAEDARMDMRA